MPVPTLILVEANGNGGAGPVTTAGITPADNELYILVAMVSRSGAIPAAPALTYDGTLAGTVLGAIVIGGVSTADTSSNDYRICAWKLKCDGTQSGTGGIIMTGTYSSCTWVLARCAAADDADIQQAVADTDVPEGASVSAALAALIDANSLAFGIAYAMTVAGGNPSIPGLGAGFLSLGTDNTSTTPGVSMRAEHQANVTTVGASITTGSTDASGILALEVYSPAAGGGSVALVERSVPRGIIGGILRGVA